MMVNYMSSLYPQFLKQNPKPPTWIFYIVLILMALVVWMARAGAEVEIDLSIIARIESNNNFLAYNPTSGARGLYQITPICLEDYNRHTHSKMPANALFSPIGARKVAEWYLGIRIPQMLKFYIKDYSSIKNLDLYIIACYNWGIGNVIKWHKQGTNLNKLPQETQNYWRKYVAFNKSKSNKF